MNEQATPPEAIRQLPHSIPYEKQVLSVLMREPHRIEEAALDEGHFYLPAHKILFSEICKATDPRDLDLVNFAQILHDIGQLDMVGGPGALAEVHGHATHAGSFDKHVEELRQRKARRQMIQACHQITGACYDLSGENGDFEQFAREGFTDALETLAGASEGEDTKALIQTALRQFQERLNGKSETEGIPTLPELDFHLHGLHPGRMTVIGAFPSGGKSVLSSQILVGAAQMGVPTLFIPLEMMPIDLVDRALIQTTYLDADDWKFPKAVTNEELKRIERGVKNLANAPFHIEKAQGNRLDSIIAKIRIAHRRHGIKLVCVDYAQLIRIPNSHSELQTITEASHTLKSLAEELEIHIILPTQLNATGDTKNGRVIEEDADTWISILQDTDKESDTYKQHEGIRIDKDRHYGNGGKTVGILFNRDKIRFESGQIPQKEAKPKKRTFK